ncbi:MAG: type II toxin-antitoxin system HicB family antitoxin [Candidatus Parvarchaeota archaeon]|jgi:predicted RNase H-like HicB family nuclease|nr:type II toxin-antitoxin system HicB family antitoxin [Candidatus Parvarchaeota archaeon]MCL5420324.1 type II toxin-antitoxin system HicB family antitoxin [Candidatus Parvarchaeota archaeon]
MKFRVMIEKDEDGTYVATVSDLPGCSTEGKTKSELKKNVKEAIQAYIASLREHGEPVPVEMIQVGV